MTLSTLSSPSLSSACIRSSNTRSNMSAPYMSKKWPAIDDGGDSDGSGGD
jgi:hypothetical protein